jgi:hypothetical protein
VFESVVGPRSCARAGGRAATTSLAVAKPLGEGYARTWHIRVIKVATRIKVTTRCVRVFYLGRGPFLSTLGMQAAQFWTAPTRHSPGSHAAKCAKTWWLARQWVIAPACLPCWQRLTSPGCSRQVQARGFERPG